MKSVINLLKIISIFIFENIIYKLYFNLKGCLFKNKDILSGEELVEYSVISTKSKEKLIKLKKLRQLNNIYYIWDYNSDFKKVIFSYKYNRKIKLSKIIAQLINEEINFIIQREKIDLIISVPINKKRKNERGFNQVDEILKNLNINYLKLERVKNTKKMHNLLDENLRKENIKGSFKLKSNIKFENKNILLVDDIITTGSTLREIKNIILDSCPKYKKSNIKIVVFCLAAAKEIKINKGEV